MFATSGGETLSEKAPLLTSNNISSEVPSVWFRLCHSIDTVFFNKKAEDDVVSLGVKQLCIWFSVTAILWMVSFVLIMLEIVDRNRVTKDNLTLFFPMLIGSSIGLLSIIAVSVRVCRNATLISKERRMHMRRQGTETASLFVDYDSLPLMRRLFCWNLSLGITFLMLIIAQVLFSMWFLCAEVELWHALVPVILVLCAYLSYLYMMAFMSLTSCGFGTLAVFQMMLFVMKCNDQLGAASWTITLLPLDVTLVAAYSYTAFICVNIAEGRYALNIAQKIALAGYILALLALSFAVARTVYNEYMEDIVVRIANAAIYDCIGTAQYLMCTFSVCVLTLSLIVVLNSEGRALARNRGFREPLPLSHSNEGWVPTHDCGDVYMLLLGTIEVTLPSPSHISQFGANHDNLPPRSSILHGGVHLSERSLSPLRRTEQENKEWEGEIELLLRRASPGAV